MQQPKWIKFYTCGSDHPSPAVCLDVADDCANRYEDMRMDDILRAVALELAMRPMRPAKPKTCIPACSMTPAPIVEEPPDEEESEVDHLKHLVDEFKQQKEEEEAAKRRTKEHIEQLEEEARKEEEEPIASS